jgi:DNA-binding MarR family transcriptional regulator
MMSREELIQGIIENLARCQRPAMDANWKQFGLSHAQMSMLYLLFYHKRSNAKQIAEFLGITNSAVAQLMDPLVDKGLVSRQHDSKDRRIVHLSLTPEGRGVLKKLSRHKFAGLRTALGALDDEDLEHTHRLFQKIAKNG